MLRGDRHSASRNDCKKCNFGFLVTIYLSGTTLSNYRKIITNGSIHNFIVFNGYCRREALIKIELDSTNPIYSLRIFYKPFVFILGPYLLRNPTA